MQSGLAVDQKLGGAQESLRRFANYNWHHAPFRSVRYRPDAAAPITTNLSFSEWASVFRGCQDDHGIAGPAHASLPYSGNRQRQLPIQEQLRTATTTDHQEGEGDQELIHNVSMKFTNQGGSRFDGNGGSALHGNQQPVFLRLAWLDERFLAKR